MRLFVRPVTRGVAYVGGPCTDGRQASGSRSMAKAGAWWLTLADGRASQNRAMPYRTGLSLHHFPAPLLPLRDINHA